MGFQKMYSVSFIEIPSPVYSQSYYLGSNIQDEIVKDWFTQMLGDYSNNERAIMHGMMVNGTNMNTDDCRYAVLIWIFSLQFVSRR